MKTDWTSYPSPGFHDELVGPGGGARAAGRALMRYLTEMDGDEIAVRQQAAELAIKAMGITFTVYHEQDGSIDRAWPLDIIPRTISRKEWQKIEAGLIQRAAALNLFIDDVYHEQKFIKDGLMPASIIADVEELPRQVRGIKPPLGIWAHICGSDLIRDKDGTVYVLEDNLRVPSGVSYMLENRQVIKRVFPELFESAAILPVDDYPSQLYDMLTALSPRKETRPEVVVLTPGIYNSAYFEHAYLARQMGCELVEGRDLAVDSDDCVYMQTVRGWTRVDVIYRRIDDDFLDSGSVPQGFLARRARPHARLGGGQGGARECAGRRRRRRQARLYVRAGHDQVLPRRGRDPAERAVVALRRSEAARSRARASRTSWS